MKQIKSIFTTWWKPMIGLLGVVLIFGLGALFERDWIMSTFLYSLLGIVLIIAISFVVLLFKMKWLGAIAQALITVPIVYYTILIFTYSPPDYFASRLTIPTNIEIEEPLHVKLSEIESRKDEFDFELCGERGIYHFFSTHTPNESGTLYVKAYEITNEDRLSARRMKDRSSIKVSANQSGVKSNDFTIYEGLWGQMYAARIELWFSADSGTEELIANKNYIVEGWMR